MKTSTKEEEFIARQELERLKKLEDERMRRMAEEEKRKQKELHYMHCPKCGMELKEVEFKGIRIDRCFNCDGIWLDAGELEEAMKAEKGGLDKIFGVFKKQA